MFPSHSAQQSAIASQLAGELAEYEAGMHRLLEEHWDPELYRQLSDQFDLMQLQAQGLPRIAVSWTELLISRAELTHALWEERIPARVNGRVVALHAQHTMLVREVLRKCLRYVTRPAGDAPLSGADRPPADPRR
jgi:hypothetical protein